MNIKNRKAIIGTGPQRVQKPIKILNFSAQNEHQKFQSYYRNAPKTGSKTDKNSEDEAVVAPKDPPYSVRKRSTTVAVEATLR